MKEKRDLVAGLVNKGRSDLIAFRASLDAGASDAACFHAQQAAEKFLKAALAQAGIAFPYTHNLTKLVELSAGIDAAFLKLRPLVEPLTPYAVELRYDSDFWPGEDEAEAAGDAAVKVRDLAFRFLPTDLRNEDDSRT